MRLENVCGRKVSFRTKAAAQRVADKFDQRVYSCPVCFTYHCTSKQDWRQEFYSFEQVEEMRKQGAFGSKKSLKPLNIQINQLLKEVSDLKKTGTKADNVEINRLQAENRKLRKENNRLKQAKPIWRLLMSDRANVTLPEDNQGGGENDL